MYEIKEFSDWNVYKDKGAYGSGASKKIWLINKDRKIGLFKYPKKHTSNNSLTGEHCSEKIASEIAKVLHIPCAEVDLGYYKGDIGSISYMIIDPKEETLVEGLHYILKQYPNYNEDLLYDETTKARYSLNMILKCLKDIPFKNDILVIPIFDSLIGNSDRHHSNWGIIVNRKEEPLRLSPLYDNSSSLCCRELDTNIISILKDKNRFNALVDSKAKSSIRWNNEKKITHFQLLEHIYENYEEETRIVVENIKIQLTDKIIHDIIFNINDNIMSLSKKELIEKVLIEKRNRILKIYKI